MLKVWMSHGDKVTALPPGFKLMASTPSCPIAGMADEARGYYAVQFHPEVTHTVQGRRCSSASCARSAAAPPTGSCATTSRGGEKIRAQVGDEEVILGLSGGVDSSAWPRR
jgi:GMP synthase (glutamine-hydrolysing)